MKNLLSKAVMLICGLVLIGYAFAWSQTKPSGIPVTYSGVTNSTGVFTFTFPNPYTIPPNVQVQVIGGTNKQAVTTNVSESTVVVKVENRVDVVGLLPSFTNVVGANVDLLVTAKE